jgi:hypothetical protein
MIYDNRIESNIGQTFHGIRIDNSQAEVKGNIISDHNAGFWIDNQSYVRTPYSGDGLNQITGNVYGIYIEDESDLEFGYVDPWAPSYHYGSCNQLYNNSSYNVYMTGFSYMWAHGNYWYPTPPSGINSGGSGIEYDCFLQYYWDCESFVNCRQGQMMGVAGIETDDNEKMLRDAQTARMQQDYKASNALFQEILNGEATNLQLKMALRGLYRNHLDTEDPSLVDVIDTWASTNSDVGVTATRLMLKAHAGSGNLGEAANIAQSLIDAFPDSETEKDALLFLSFLSGYDNSQKSVSESAVNALISKYGDSLDKGILTAMVRKEESGSMAGTDESSEPSTLDASAYPNPFNPMTTINFSIPEKGLVMLRIYDVLGRVVASLVNEEREAGPQRVEWNASKVPSGVYFSRLETQSGAVVNKLLLMR